MHEVAARGFRSAGAYERARVPEAAVDALVAALSVRPGTTVPYQKGLGYNRRALNLHRAARVAVDRHGGVLPRDLDALLALPGVGPYTARAVLAFAFGVRHTRRLGCTHGVHRRAPGGDEDRPGHRRAAGRNLGRWC